MGEQLTLFDMRNSITTLDVSSRGLNELDVSKYTNLRYLYCNNNKLETLDVSKNIKLNELDCYYNPNLKEIIVSREQTMSIDKDKYTKIVYK